MEAAARFLQEFSKKRQFTPPHAKHELIRELAEKTGLLPFPIPIILITGTCGKGSTATFLSAILESNGYKAGMIQSPHLISFAERIQINRTPMAETTILEKIEELLPYFRGNSQATAKNPYGPLNYNLVFLLAGMHLFKQQAADIVLLETGIGGYNDPASFFTPVLSIITNVFKDHQNVLGDTVEQIAYDKSGVIKEKVPVITGTGDLAALRVIEREAGQKRAPLYVLGRDFTVSEEGDGWVRYSGAGGELAYRLRVEGAFQWANSALAIQAAFLLREVGYALEEDRLREGLSLTSLTGRFQIIRREPLTVVDGAHNEEEIRRFCETVRKFGCRLHYMILGFSSDRDIPRMLDAFAGLACVYLFVSHSNVQRAKPPEEILTILKESGQAYKSFASLDAAYQYAAARATEKDGIFFTGSMFLAGDALAMFGRGL